MDDKEKPDDSHGESRVPARGLMVWLMILSLVVLVFYSLVPNPGQVERIPYKPTFVNYVEQGKVRSVEIFNEGPSNQYIKGELVDLEKTTGKQRKFRVDVLLNDDLLAWLQKNVPQYQVKQPNLLMRDLINTLVPLLLILGLIYFLFVRQMKMAGKGAMSFGKSRARLLTRAKNRATFKDVAGVDEAKEELKEIVEFLKDPKKFQRLGGRIPKGVLLVGPPGTGKTLLAKAIAGEAEVPFFSISGSDFVEMFVGVGASRVRDMFEQGKKNAPCIIFIDEIDAVGRSRFSGIGGGHDEREQTLNALLVEMDGFDTQEGVIIIAATNRPDVLDNALLRPGRFDRQVVVDPPTLRGRHEILQIHSKKVKMAEGADLHRCAKSTPGFSGADLANLINEAALLAGRRGAEAVEDRDLEEARDKVRFGSERRSREMDEKERRLTAYHEAGHAIVMEALEHAEPVHKVTIIPRGASLGSTMFFPEKDRYTQGRKQLEAMIVSLMGGRAAEELVMDDITTGASNDLKQATAIARAMVCQFGMSEAVGPQHFSANEEHLFMGREVARSQNQSEETARAIDQEISRILRESYDHALRLLREHRAQLDTMAQTLLERETIDGRDVEDIVRHNRIRPDEERRLDPVPARIPPDPVPAGVVTDRPTAAGEVNSLPVAPRPFAGPEVSPASRQATPGTPLA
jgi:cell division protease FtsH